MTVMPRPRASTGSARQRPEAEGFIHGSAARLATAGPGLRVRHVARTVATCPEIVSAWTLTGEADYRLRIHCEDLAAVNKLFHQVILPDPAVARVQRQIAMDQVKADAPLPCHL